MTDLYPPPPSVLSRHAFCEGLGADMIEIDLQETRGVVSLRPHPPLRREDFVDLAATVGPYLERKGVLKGLLILAPAFPGWEDLAAVREHLAFVGRHHRAICRVAVVSDAPAFKVLPALVRRFVDPEVELAAGSGLRFLRFQSRPLMWIEIDGRVTREDFATLAAAMEEQIGAGAPVSCLIRVRKFGGFDAAAIWDELKFARENLCRIDRVALVGDVPLGGALAALSERFAGPQWLEAPNPAVPGNPRAS
jgi:hypothetical protein